MSNDKCRSCNYGCSEFNPDFPPCLECQAEEEANNMDVPISLIAGASACDWCPSAGLHSVCGDCTTR